MLFRLLASLVSQVVQHKPDTIISTASDSCRNGSVSLDIHLRADGDPMYARYSSTRVLSDLHTLSSGFLLSSARAVI